MRNEGIGIATSMPSVAIRFLNRLRILTIALKRRFAAKFFDTPDA